MAHEFNPLEHVVDHDFLELPLLGRFHLPAIPLPGHHFQFTRFMVLEFLAAGLVCLFFIPLARRLQRTGQLPRGPLANMLEAMLIFIRDEVARPAIGSGHHEDFGEDTAQEQHEVHQLVHTYERPVADRFVPFLWTLFLFILFCNLLGLVPGGGSPTASITMTAVLAILTYGFVLFSGMKQLGVAGYWKAQVPHMDMPLPLKLAIAVIIWPIEVLGNLIKHCILAVRLFANMFAGHTVLAVILGFIILALGAGHGYIYLVGPASVIGVVLLSLLELFVAFLQAYIFTFLAALFIGMALHPH